ncbi:unnamed protein product [Urochloa humidicola]
MRPHLLTLVLLLAATATVPLVSAICISRFDKSESKSKSHGADGTNGGSVKTLSLDEYGLPKKVVEKPKEVNPYEKPDKLEESSAPKKVKKEKSDDSDVSAAYLKKEKKEKSGESDKKEKKKFVDFDVSASPKKEKKEKSDDSYESSSSKKKKKNKSDGSDDYVSPNKKEKKEKKSDDSDEDASAKKAKKEEEKKKKALKADASAYFKKEKKAEKAKKKGKSKDSSEDEEKSDEDAAPVDVSATGEYVSPSVAKSEEDTTPADASSVPTELAPAAKTYADDYASQKTNQQQPMGGAPDELPPSAKSAAASTTSQQPMGGAPDELPPSSTKGSGDPYAGVPSSEPKQNKPKLSMESFGDMKMKLPFAHPHMPVSPETKRVCGDTQYPEDCEESIAELPVGAGGAQPAADPVAVLRLAMEAVREKAIVAMNAATERMNTAGMEPVVKEALDDCAKSYMDIKAVLGLVDDALKRGDLATARTNLDSVETDITSCDDGFNERGTPSVMTDHDQELQKLASDLIAIGANSIHHA